MSAPDSEPDLRRSRTREKDERVAEETALKKLAQQLGELGQAELRALQLDEPLLAALADHRKIKSAPAQARHLRFIRSLLRDLDWLLLQRKVDRQKAGTGGSPVTTGIVADWATRLPIAGDEGLSLFLTQYPDADRRRLRQLVRAVQLAPDTKKEKVRRQLESLIDVTIRTQSEGQGS